VLQKRDQKRRGLHLVLLGMACVLLGLSVVACTQLLNLSPAAWVTSTEDAHLRGTADALAHEAQLLLVTPNPFEAMDLLYEAIALQPDVAEYHFYMGEANFYLRNYEQAVEWLSSAIALDPDYVSAYRMRGDAAMLLEDFDLAQESYEQLME
jgi:tetratricopeptide (TPR) repeat protein